MNFSEYQALARRTWTPKDRGFPLSTLRFARLSYLTLGLNGEAGEVAEHIKKYLRDDGACMPAEREDQIVKELGDALWYLSMLADELGFKLEDVAQKNVDKLADRAERGVIGGSGDER